MEIFQIQKKPHKLQKTGSHYPIKDKQKVCVMELWKYALDNEFSKPTRRESNEITLILQSIGGWERGKIERHQEFGNQMFWNRTKPIELPPLDSQEFTILP